MTRRLPPLNWLRSFEAAARHLSFTATGEELHLTQAAVSQHMKSLEQYLGQPLFVRMPRSLRLTDQGRAYQRRIEPLLSRIADDTEELFGSRDANQITVRANAAFSILWLAPRLNTFLKAHAGLQVHIVNPIWSFQEMEEGADFEIRYGDGQWPGLQPHRLTWDRLFPVCAPTTDRGDIRSALTDNPLIHVMGYRDGWPDWMRSADLTALDARSGIQCDNSIMAFELAATGAGFAIARTSLVDGMLKNDRLVRAFDEDAPTTESFYLVEQGKPAASRTRTAFRDWLLDEAQRFHAESSSEN